VGGDDRSLYSYSWPGKHRQSRYLSSQASAHPLCPIRPMPKLLGTVSARTSLLTTPATSPGAPRGRGRRHTRPGTGPGARARGRAAARRGYRPSGRARRPRELLCGFPQLPASVRFATLITGRRHGVRMRTNNVCMTLNVFAKYKHSRPVQSIIASLTDNYPLATARWPLQPAPRPPRSC